MALLKRQAEDLQELRDIADDVDEAIFVPYACHVDPHTILTKNGELMQTLKIVGFTYEDITETGGDLRHFIRAALREALQGTDYAVWLHTIRRKASLATPGEYPPNFSGMLNGMWRELNDWEHKYVNEVYITLVKEGENAKLKQVQHFMRGLIPAVERAGRWKFIENSLQELTATVDRMHQSLTKFGARKLGLYEKDSVVYSEPISFLNKLITLVDEPMPLPDISLADYLTTHEVTFGFNALEVRELDGKRRFGSILTLKDYRELPVDSVDLLLQVEGEFIISQCMDFINPRKALSEYEEQQEIFSLSQEEELPHLTGLKEILGENQYRPIDFGEHQMNIFILGDSVKEMEANTKKMVRALNGLGLLALREDIKFEEAYWSQLPANFEFLRRLKPISAKRVGGLANISNVPAGLANGSKWGPPVTTLSTAIGTPYFFNFHIDQNGHTAIIGPYGVGKTVLLNFLLSEAQKFQPRLYYFDPTRGAEIFLRSIQASYQFIERRVVHESERQDRPSFHQIPQMNPLQLDDTPQNRSFMLVWLDALLRADQFYRPEMSEEFWPMLQEALDFTLRQLRPLRKISTLVDYLQERHPKVAAKMYGWVRDGKYARWFDHESDTLDVSARQMGLAMAEVMQDEQAAPAIVAYLMHRIASQLNGEPAIIVMDEAWAMLDNATFTPRLGQWLEMLRSRNAIAIMATEKADEVLSSPLSATIMEQIATQIYLPNPQMDIEEYARIFGLTEVEVVHVIKMSRRRRQFLMKRGHQSIVAELDLHSLPAALAMLSARDRELNHMTKLITEHGEDPQGWLHHFFNWVEEENLKLQAEQRSAA